MHDIGDTGGVAALLESAGAGPFGAHIGVFREAFQTFRPIRAPGRGFAERVQGPGEIAVGEVCIGDNRRRPAMRVRHDLHPARLHDFLSRRPIRLDVYRARHTLVGDIVEEFGDRIVAPQPFVGAEDARLHGALSQVRSVWRQIW